MLLKNGNTLLRKIPGQENEPVALKGRDRGTVLHSVQPPGNRLPGKNRRDVRRGARDQN